ncbi:MAG: aldehyde dehydrogenase family protein [Proteobacteria bacterium]|nr:aldehyde dehydrogenase family protein [Pseudomonadota bacterium]HQR03472.1 aldehyde dehydrogenase family protein [Rhodocyclaceae bacterium]
MNEFSTLIARQKARLPALAKTTAMERIRKLRDLYRAVYDARDEMVEISRKELGLCEIDALMQLMMIKSQTDFIAEHLEAWMAPQPIPNLGGQLIGKKAWVRYEPKGLMLHIASWNAPTGIALGPAGFGIAAGNAVVVKPSELTPASASFLRRVVGSVFPEDEFAIVEGGHETVSALLQQPFNHIAYVGGHGGGRAVMRGAAEHFADITLEMGGKNPVLVDPSADIMDAADKVARWRLPNAGQICVAPDYVLIHPAQRDDFVAGFARTASAMYNPAGKGFDQSPEFPRIVSDGHFQRIKGLIDDALEKGAHLAFGGATDATTRFIAPTVLTGVTEDMKIMKEEVFGPVLSVMDCATPEEILAAVGRRFKPLALYIYAKDPARAQFYMANTSSGAAVINNCGIQAANPTVPFGGVNHSGVGRLGGQSAFAEFCNPRTVVEDPCEPSPHPAGGPPYGPGMKEFFLQMIQP